MFQQGRAHSIQIVFVIALLCVFVITALLLALLGARVYGNVADRAAVQNDLRASAFYITEKTRQIPGEARVEQVDGGDALVLSETVAGRTYETWLFCAQRHLREVTVAAGETVKPGDGQSIMGLAALDSQLLDNGLLEVVVTRTGGQQYRALIALSPEARL